MEKSSNKNDERILKLKEKLAQRKKEAEHGIFNDTPPKTNCHISLDGVDYNLHVCDEDKLRLLLVKLHALEMSANDLYKGYEMPEIRICNYPIAFWMDDIKTELSSIHNQKYKAQLDKADSELDKLLSDDKKTELALDKIEDLLN